MDPNHPTVQFCSEGMIAESHGRLDDARGLFEQAWEARSDDYYASVAAHFVARQQETLEQKLDWNERALAYADAVGDERVASFYPSLHLNVGYSHEQLGNMSEAARFYRLAAGGLDAQQPGPLGDLVRTGVAAGLARVEGTNRQEKM